ncbi:hypothetical protein T4A_12271 [Trichinella pseudospiralis]|uniref:Uncharacterized protein n=1 Tax=Trichinella pseudospiralis TaxID=6337 RepID=A0A0V1EX76_TRIPS|nr:hypothetical protein T4A_12271 [Trichinella pseudospiralis]
MRDVEMEKNGERKNSRANVAPMCSTNSNDGNLDNSDWIPPTEVLTKSSDHHTDADMRDVLTALEIDECDNHANLKYIGIRIMEQVKNECAREYAGHLKHLLSKAFIPTPEKEKSNDIYVPESFEKAVESAAREEPMVIQITARNTNVSLTMVSVDFDCKILRNPWEYPNSQLNNATRKDALEEALPVEYSFHNAVRLVPTTLHERHSGVQVFGLPRTSSSEEHTSRLREVLDRLAD